MSKSNTVLYFEFKSIPVDDKPSFCLYLDKQIFKHYRKTEFSRKEAVLDDKAEIKKETNRQKPRKTVVKFIM